MRKIASLASKFNFHATNKGDTLEILLPLLLFAKLMPALFVLKFYVISTSLHPISR